MLTVICQSEFEDQGTDGSESVRHCDLPEMDADAAVEAANSQLIAKVMELERLMSLLRMVQTVVMILERMLPLMEESRTVSRGSVDIVAMLQDHSEAHLEHQLWELREQILAQYHRAIRNQST